MVPDKSLPAQDKSADLAEIHRALALFFVPGQVTELRALEVSTPQHRRPHTVSGYFDDLDALATEAAKVSRSARGTYILPNFIDTALLARAANRVRAVDREPTTADTNILRRRWLLLDADPVRPAGISSTEAEHAAALARVQEVAAALTAEGWPAGALADSGNGGHLPYRIDLPNDDASRTLLEGVLQALAFRFDDAVVTLDQKVFNAARIWKLYGTVARKGDHTADRPHRLARLLSIPDTWELVTRAQLEALARQRPKASQDQAPPHGSGRQRGEVFDIERWIAEHGLEVTGPQPWQGGRKWIFSVCPWNSEHRNRSAYLVERHNGALDAGCHHNSCAGKDWQALRALYEPGWQARMAGQGAVVETRLAPPSGAEEEAAGPPLPEDAQVDEALAAEAAPWLDAYIRWSQKWAPRAYEGFHEACGLFDLSTTAARRIKLRFGSGVYTSLYQALAGRTTLWTKTTAADLAVELLKRAGLGLLLADDDATPQAFIRALTAQVPEDCDRLTAEARAALCERLAFAAQKGWFFEELGQLLEAMMRKDGHMAAFRGILRRLDDHKDSYVYHTISRGREVLTKPYLTLLANLTPADLRDVASRNSALWRDGFLARMAFICPTPETRSEARFPDETITYPTALTRPLRDWHQRLGIPTVDLEPILDKKQKSTGRYRLHQEPLRETTYTLVPAVWDRFYAYDAALRRLASQAANEDLDGSYGRFAVKALRVAGLLASLQDTTHTRTVELRHWHRGQQIAEHWRASLHRLLGQLDQEVTQSRAAKVEDHLVRTLKKQGALSPRELGQRTGLAMIEILTGLDALQQAGLVDPMDTAHTRKFRYRYEATNGHAPTAVSTEEETVET